MLRLLLLALLLAGCSASAPAEAPTQQRAVEARLADLFAVAAAPDADAEALALLLVARTSNAARAWKVPADVSRPDERAYAESALATLRGILDEARQTDGSVAYETLEYVVQPESEGLWHVLRIEFDTPDGPIDGFFAFLPVGDAFLLGDIDR